MNLNAPLEIIILMVALYWLLSTACSYFVEGINSLLMNVRAKALERFVCEMVLSVNKVPQLLRGMPWFSRSNLGRTQRPGQVGGNADASSLADPLGLFSRGLIQSLRKPQLLPSSTATAPPCISSKVFAQALLDRLDSLAWSVAPAMASAAVVTGVLRSPVSPLDARWKAALAGAQCQRLQAAPLLAMVTGLLRPLNDMTVSQARRESSGLLMDFGLPSRRCAVNQSEALLAAQHPPTELLAHLVRILEAAAAALEALPDLDKIDPLPMHQVIGAEALWLLAVRKAGEAVLRHEGLALAEQFVREQGRPAIAQQILFKPIGDKQGWQDFIDEALVLVEVSVRQAPVPASADAASGSASAAVGRRCAWYPDRQRADQRLTEQIRDLLLSSAGLLGVSRRIDALALDTALSDTHGPALREALCKATLDTQARAGPDREASAHVQISQAAATLLSTWPACAWIDTRFGIDRQGLHRRRALAPAHPSPRGLKRRNRHPTWRTHHADRHPEGHRAGHRQPVRDQFGSRRLWRRDGD